MRAWSTTYKPRQIPTRQEVIFHPAAAAATVNNMIYPPKNDGFFSFHTKHETDYNVLYFSFSQPRDQHRFSGSSRGGGERSLLILTTFSGEKTLRGGFETIPFSRTNEVVKRFYICSISPTFYEQFFYQFPFRNKCKHKP